MRLTTPAERAAALAELRDAALDDPVQAARAIALYAGLRAGAPDRVVEFSGSLALMHGAFVAHADELRGCFGAAALTIALDALEAAQADAAALLLAADLERLDVGIAEVMRRLVPRIGPLLLWPGWRASDGAATLRAARLGLH